MTGLTLRCMRIYRITSANTHFEEWWFKTFYKTYGIRGFYYMAFNSNVYRALLPKLVRVLFV